MTPSQTNNEKTLSRREREKLAHRLEIMDAATHVFSRKGYHNATLDEIAQEAEFSKGALYLYFSSKEDLLFSIMCEKLEVLKLTIPAIFSSGSSFKEELTNLFLSLADTSFTEADFFSLVISQKTACFHALSEEKAAECIAQHAEFDDMIIERIKKAIENKELRDIDPHAIYGVIHGASENMMYSRWNAETAEELKKRVYLFIDILCGGIVREKEV